MSPISLEMLPAASDVALRSCLRRWEAARTSAEPANRVAAEHGIRRAYRSAGFAEPQRIIWFDGPQQLGRQLVQDSPPTMNVEIVGRPLQQAFDKVSRRLGPHIISELGTFGRENSRPFESRLAKDALVETVSPPTKSAARRLWFWASRHWSKGRSGSPPPLWTQYETEWLWYYDFIGGELTPKSDTSMLGGLFDVAQNAGFAMFCRDVCYAGERHQTLHLDTAGRLHALDGPAITWRDGAELYFWKGRAIAPELIHGRATITAERIDKENDRIRRRCMLALMTPARYIESRAAFIVNKDDTGTLWRKFWANDSWSCVEVINGTPEPSGEYKRYYLEVPSYIQSAREAVAWTYGLSAEDYFNLVKRT